VEHFENVTLPDGPRSRYQLRREPKEGGLATMEAIARAYGVLEGPHAKEPLERVFHEMVRRSLMAKQQPRQVKQQPPQSR
jgi:DTW domain-containing protein